MVNRYDKWLRWVLVLTGIVMLLALPAVVMPKTWMAALHQKLEMGDFPEQPIAEHLARWTSALYALLGALTLLFATDLAKYRQAITGIALGIPAVSCLLFIMDNQSGLPVIHLLADLISAVSFGAAVLVLQRLSRKTSDANHAAPPNFP